MRQTSLSSGKERNRLRLALSWIFLVFLLLVISYQISELETKSELFLNDFVAFWSAGRLIATGHNPYAAAQLLELQRGIGWKKVDPERSWNPPWTLLFIIPFGLLNFSIAAKLWLIMHFAIVFLSSDWLWRLYGGPRSYRWLAWIIGIFFFPSLYLLKIGQISAMVLLGIVGFLYFMKNDKHLLAGFSILFIAIKPNLLYLFGVALFLWVIERRCWSLLLGITLALSFATFIPFCLNPEIITHYFNAIMDAPIFLSQWATPTFGTLFRVLLGMEKPWLQFIAPTAGTIWFLQYWAKHHKKWEWQEQTPLLLLVSLITTSYAWGYDKVVLLIPALQAASWIFRLGKNRITFWAITSFLGINSLAFILPTANAFWFIWMAPSLLVWYWIVRKLAMSTFSIYPAYKTR